ncbi:MAG: UDP-N-acetylmuramoyl-L-alanine--D-glutamate ligase [Spirochaetae bacterium HGW-Spirochaetae-3]|jgi:UDP-N-acetylmuramoylalanine--D-glutamate ligase|nr:MAG: UDP-N-acetylmuramoyl-L-alanine--D-glutamate ligase [Spirochaetae bacterium HGW-Spirochaetae-3]
MQTIRLEDIPGLRVTVMGLGLNGGGLASARFFAERGAAVTVTDTKDESALAESVAALSEYDIRYVLGRHDEADFSGADLVIKNPAVRPDNPFLRAAKTVETDLSIFLRLCPARIAAVTGSKGKSTTSTALAWMLNAGGVKAFLGGNITVSPLGFLDVARPSDVVVLELSSWQLGDLKGKGALRPCVAAMTRIVPDHLDRYGTMEAYVADKRLIYADQGPTDWTVYDIDDPYGRSFASETRARALAYGSELPAGAYGVTVPEGGPCVARLPGTDDVELVPARLLVPGAHSRRNVAAAAVSAWACGADPRSIASAAATFPGIEHRLEPIRERRGVRWYNDSAATVPEAASAAVEAFEEPVVLITGGTDKQLDFQAARAAYRRAEAVVLLAGTGTDKIRAILDADSIAYRGPFGDIVTAVAEAARLARPGYVAVLSPGCTSFGMFKNEFDRGRSYKEAVAALPD